MMGFIKRNGRELLWATFSLCGVASALWLAIAQPDANKAIDLYSGAVCYVVFVVGVGYRVWAIFDNYEQDALNRQLRDALAMTCYPAGSYSLDLGDGTGLTYTRPPLPRPANRIEEEIRRRLNDGDAE